MTDPRLLETASAVLGLDALGGDEEALALLEVVQGAVGPGLAALAAIDVAAFPTEPDLDPSRAPRPPVA